MKSQMAQMETEGRAEEFVTSAGNIPVDQAKMEEFRSKHQGFVPSLHYQAAMEH